MKTLDKVIGLLMPQVVFYLSPFIFLINAHEEASISIRQRHCISAAI
jgi:hypothetical protein